MLVLDAQRQPGGGDSLERFHNLLTEADTLVHLAVGGNIPFAGFQPRAQYAVAPDGRFLRTS